LQTVAKRDPASHKPACMVSQGKLAASTFIHRPLKCPSGIVLTSVVFGCYHGFE